jgi:hypothetical protein
MAGFGGGVWCVWPTLEKGNPFSGLPGVEGKQKGEGQKEVREKPVQDPLVLSPHLPCATLWGIVFCAPVLLILVH